MPVTVRDEIADSRGTFDVSVRVLGFILSTSEQPNTGDLRTCTTTTSKPRTLRARLAKEFRFWCGLFVALCKKRPLRNVSFIL
jgi:hypothetical protein